jgi:hypothetical protein
MGYFLLLYARDGNLEAHPAQLRMISFLMTRYSLCSIHISNFVVIVIALLRLQEISSALNILEEGIYVISNDAFC